MKPLEQYTIDGLKILAYDTLVSIEQSQNNMKIINARIQELSVPKPKEVKKDGK